MKSKHILAAIFFLTAIALTVIILPSTTTTNKSLDSESQFSVSTQSFSKAFISSSTSSSVSSSTNSNSSVSISPSPSSSSITSSSVSSSLGRLKLVAKATEQASVKSATLIKQETSSSSTDPKMASWKEFYNGIEPVPEVMPSNALVINRASQTYELIREGKTTLTGNVTTGGHYPAPDNMWSATHSGVYWVSNKSNNVEMSLYGASNKRSQWFISIMGNHNTVNKSEGFVGIHDSNWRSVFGQTFDYKNRGTNGCITMPDKDMETLFSILKLNDSIIII